MINTWDAPRNLMMQALVVGVLEMSADGCLYLRHGDSRSDAVWPYGFTADIDDRGSVVVLDDTGAVVARVGMPLSAAGGFVEAGQQLACRVTGPDDDVTSVDGEMEMRSP